MSSVKTKVPASAPTLEEPYVGLTYFTEDYADRFFGRGRESTLIISNLCAARLTLLYAESGVGKSSVLRAGVVAHLHEAAAEELRAGGGVRLVPVVFSSWSERPVAALVGAIGEAIRPYLGKQEAPDLPAGDLAGALKAAGEAFGGTVLVILDQFEEYFLYPDGAPEQDRIAAQVARCVNDNRLRANFLISIREDSYARLGDLFRGKVRDVYGNFLHLDFLDRGGAREAIEKPIEGMNALRPRAEPFAVEPALVDAVLDQVRRDEGDDKVETTYLQLVMRRLWEEETAAGSRALRLRTLERLGGAQAIIGSHLDRAMEAGEDGRGLGEEQRRVAAAIFRFLVTSGGTKIALTAADLADLTGLSTAEIEPVLRHLSSPRLHILRPVVSQEEGGEPRFEIFHDALAAPINKWRTQVEDKERERERAEKEEAQRAAARAERRARVAQALLALAVLALLAGAAVFAIRQKDLADQREADNQSVRAAERIAELAHVPTFGPAAAALASVEDYGLSGTAEARNQSLAQLQLDPGLARIAVGHTREAVTVAYLPGSSDFASGGSEGTIRLWNARGGEIGSPVVVSIPVVGLAVSKAKDGGRILAAGLDGGALDLWRLTGSQPPRHLRKLRVGGGRLWGVAFNPRLPGMLAVAGAGGAVTLWSVKNPRRPVLLGRRAVEGEPSGLAFAADGRTLFEAGTGGGVALGVTGKGFASARPVPGSGGEEWAVGTAPNGSYAFGGPEGIVLWDAARGRRLRLRPLGTVDALEFAGNGSVLVSAGTDRSVTTWDVASGRPFGPPRAFEKVAQDVAVSSDGRSVVAAGEDGLVKAWALRPRLALATTLGSLGPERSGALPEVDALAVGNGGGAVAAAAGPAGTSIWPLRASPAPGSPPRPLAEIPGTSYAVAYRGDILVTGRGNSFAVYGTGASCPEGQPKPCLLATPRQPYSRYPITFLALARYGHRLLLASGGYRRGEGVNLWDLTDAIEGGAVAPPRWLPVEGKIRRIALSPAEPLLAVGFKDGKLRLWDAADPRAPREIKVEHPRGNENQAVDAIAFSPDGSLLASGGEDQRVVFWRVSRQGSGPPTVEASKGTLIQGQSIFSLAFSPDGKTLAAGDAEGSTCLYELASRRPIGGGACLRGDRSDRASFGGTQATEFARLPDGSTVLLTAGAGQSIFGWNSILWNLSGDDGVEGEIAKYVCALAGRDLNAYEWDAIFASTKLSGDRHPTCRE